MAFIATLTPEPVAPPAEAATRYEQIEFTGDGNEYFRIFDIDLAL